MTSIQGLDCEVVQGTQATPRVIVVLCHGYGAPGNDLVSLAPELLHRFGSLTSTVRFVFPAAPLSLEQFGGGARAWWHLDLDRMMAAQSTDPADAARLLAHQPEGLPAVRKQMLGLCAELRGQVPGAKLVLGGFSQGAMLATDIALRLEEAPAALAVLSGTLICAEEWARRAPIRAGLKVLQSHGRQDTVLGFDGAVALKELLERSGLEVDFIPFDGGHTIALPALEKLGAMLTAL